MTPALADAAAALLLGAACPGCGAPAARLCQPCAGLLAAVEPFAVPGPALPVVAAASYEGAWRALLVAFKERGAWWLAGALGPPLALATAEALARARREITGSSIGPVLLVPMPSRPASVRARGLDTTRALAARCAAALRTVGLAASVSAELRHARAVSDQAGLPVSARVANLGGALAARPRGAGVRVVVDDVTTSGASLAEACRALREAGMPASACAVVAATPRQRWQPRC